MSVSKMFGLARSLRLDMELYPAKYAQGVQDHILSNLFGHKPSERVEIEETLIPYLKTFIHKVDWNGNEDDYRNMVAHVQYNKYMSFINPVRNWIDQASFDMSNTDNMSYNRDTFFNHDWCFSKVVIIVRPKYSALTLDMMADLVITNRQDRSDMCCVFDFRDTWGVHDFGLYIDNLERVSKATGIKRFTLRGKYDEQAGGFSQPIMEMMLRFRTNEKKVATSLIHQVGGYVELNLSVA